MGVQYYAFALFVAALISLVALIFKLLFANVRRQHKDMKEKEEKLLQLYRSVENIMEEFNDQVKTAMEDIKECEERAAAHINHMANTAHTAKKQETPQRKEETEHQQKPERQGRSMTVDSSIIRAASEVLERAERMVKNGAEKSTAPPAGKASVNGEVIQRLFDDTIGEQQIAGPEAQAMRKKRESILALAQEGKTHAQIAQELGITQNEVKLVIGLTNQ